MTELTVSQDRREDDSKKRKMRRKKMFGRNEEEEKIKYLQVKMSLMKDEWKLVK